jgi:predicted ATPase
VESERRITKKLASVRDSEGILGRETLIEELRTILVQYMQDRQPTGAPEGAARLIVLSGPAGIGKATVLRRFLGVLVDNGSVRIFKSAADAVETKTPYYPWKKIFADVLGVDCTTKASQFTTRACENALINVLEDEYAPCSVLNDILPTLFPEEKGEHKLSAIDRRAKLHEILALILNAVSAKAPVSIVVHACQFCDNASMALLRCLLSRCPGVLFVITTRSESGFSELQDLESDMLIMRHFPLPALSKENSVLLVKQTLGQQVLDQAVTDVVMDRTQGIPLYCVEFARLVKESPSGALSEMPDTITGAVLLRIDRLLPAPKLILKIVAIAKRDVRASLIYEVVPSQFSSEDLQSELEYLVSVDILMRDTNGYCFRHEMVQEVVLGFLTFSQKRFLHKRIANFYVNSESECSAATLASHFEFAAIGMSAAELDVPACKRAIWFLKVAAEEAMKANAIEDANRYLTRCHELMNMMPSSNDPFDLEMALGLVDGNEGLLRQVLDQFRVNTELSIAKIEKAMVASRNPSLSAAKTGEGIKAANQACFEARSIASAASTLGAQGVSQSALAVEDALADASHVATCFEALQKLKADFVLLSDFINNNTSSKTTTSVVVGEYVGAPNLLAYHPPSPSSLAFSPSRFSLSPLHPPIFRPPSASTCHAEREKGGGGGGGGGLVG